VAIGAESEIGYYIEFLVFFTIVGLTPIPSLVQLGFARAYKRGVREQLFSQRSAFRLADTISCARRNLKPTETAVRAFARVGYRVSPSFLLF